MKVQDRLVRALQSEVDLTNRVRESSQVRVRDREGRVEIIGSKYDSIKCCADFVG